MTALINNDHLMNENVGNFLRRSQCGIRQNSHKVCCLLNQIDYGQPSPPGVDGGENIADEKTRNVKLQDKCGKLNSLNEDPSKWIGELWFTIEGKTLPEARCIGVLITSKHLVVPAACIAGVDNENASL